MNQFKKSFIGYCAFAPYIALAMVLRFFNPTVNPWDLIFNIVIFCCPLSLIFALVSLHRPKNGRIAAFASMLASDAHLLLYSMLWGAMTVRIVPEGPDTLLIAGIMASMMMSGIALLFTWDNELNPVQAQPIEHSSC